jgi:hypothetical protein
MKNLVVVVMTVAVVVVVVIVVNEDYSLVIVEERMLLVQFLVVWEKQAEHLEMEVNFLSMHHLDTVLEHFEREELGETQKVDENANPFVCRLLKVWKLEDFEFSMMRDIQRLLELFDWACRRKYLTHGDEI